MHRWARFGTPSPHTQKNGIKNQSTASAQLPAYAHWSQTHRQTPEDWYWLLLFFAALGKAESLILTAAHRKVDLDPRYWPVTLTLTFDLDPDLWPWPYSKVTVMQKHDFGHLTLTFDLQSQPSLDQGRPPCQKSRSKIKQFSRETSDKHTHRHTNGRTDATNSIISLLRYLKLRGR